MDSVSKSQKVAQTMNKLAGSITNLLNGVHTDISIQDGKVNGNVTAGNPMVKTNPLYIVGGLILAVILLTQNKRR